MTIVEKINNIPEMWPMPEPASMEQVKEAEKELQMTFPQEFIDYALAFGCVDFGSTELNGLEGFPKGFFVFENIGIDGALIIVNSAGQVYVFQDDAMDYFCGSISEYIDICVEREFGDDQE